MATTATMAAPRVPRRGVGRAALPYLLSLPALIVCIGILVPFGTAIWYSLQRYNLNLPGLRSFIWFDQYLLLFQSAAFWNTVRVSLLYTFLTVGIELLLGLGIAEIGVEEGHQPSLDEAHSRLQHYLKHGATDFAFGWAEVLDADGYDAFVEAGNPFDPAVASRLLKYVYSSGNTIEPRAA